MKLYELFIDELGQVNPQTSHKVIKTTSRKLLYHFIVWLLGISGAKGKVVVESATAEKDVYYLKEFSYFLAPGNRDLSVSHDVIQKVLTCISFVTKQNHDIEEQIADLFAYGARCKFLMESKKEFYPKNSYEFQLVGILEKKLFKKPKFAKEKKMRFYSSIDPFCIVPKN